MRIAATLEHGTPDQVSACVPVASVLDGKDHITEEVVQTALDSYPICTSHSRRPVHLPNLVHKIVRTCFMTQRPNNRAVDPIGHVLNKAWPMRCSVRNFSDIVSAYIMKDPEVYLFICTTMHACMAGVYPSSSVTASVALRILLYKHYVSNQISQSHLAQWVRQDNHSIVFVAIKEYIVFAVSMVPGLECVLQSYYNWDQFVASVSTQADAVRNALNHNIGSPTCMFYEAQQSMMAARCFKCPAPLLDIGTICDQVATIVRTNCVPSKAVFKTPLRYYIYKLIREPLALGVPISQLAVAMRLPTDFSHLLGLVASRRATSATWKLLRSLQYVGDNTKLLVHEFVVAWTMCIKVCMYALPQHIQQSHSAHPRDRPTVLYACVCCRQVRAFVVDEGNSAGNAWACGHQKVLLDDETGTLYCGKRVEKVSSHSRRIQRSNDTGRSYWKAQQSMMCGYCPLLRMEMKGQLLSFYGKLYMLCPSCMCVMCLRNNRYHHDSIRCVNCQYKGGASNSQRCFHCYTIAPNLRHIIIGRQEVCVCTTCTRRWMDDTSLLGIVTEEVVHRAINERWGANRVAVHCSRI